jgi:hypothetical protein
MKTLENRLERLEEVLVPKPSVSSCVIEYDEHTTPEEIEAMKAERIARGARLIVLMPKKSIGI